MLPKIGGHWSFEVLFTQCYKVNQGDKGREKSFHVPLFQKCIKKVLEFSFTTTTNIQFLEIGNLVFCLSNGRNIRYQKLCQKRVK